MRTLHTHLQNLGKLALLCLFTLLIPTQLYARDVSFSWTANPEPVTGYKLYYKIGTVAEAPYDGTDLNEGGSPILLGNVTTTTVTGLSSDETYQFALTAYNDTEESDYSLVETVPPLPPMASPTIIIMSQN